MKKKVWILNHYASGMFFDKGGRHYWLAQFLKITGYEPTVFGSNTSHMTQGTRFFFDNKKLWIEHIAEEIDVPFIFVRANAESGGKFNRMLNMISFYRNVKKAAIQYAKQNGKPDVILASSVHPLTLIAGLQLAKRFHVKCICEIRDLWPEAIFAYSKRLKKTGLLAKILYWGERRIYEKADALIFTQEGGRDYVVRQGWDVDSGGKIDLSKIYHINNGVDLQAFRENRAKYRIDDPDLDNPDLFKVVYTGSIRRYNDLDKIVDVAKNIKNPRVKILVWGSGDDVPRLEARVKDEGIKNIVFKGFVNKTFVPYIVSAADLNLMHWIANPMNQIGESYNKAFEYFASCKPVLYTIRPNYSIVEKFNCGRIADGSPEKIAEVIDQIAEMPVKEREDMAINSEKVANKYDFKNLTKELIEIIESL